MHQFIGKNVVEYVPFRVAGRYREEAMAYLAYRYKERLDRLQFSQVMVGKLLGQYVMGLSKAEYKKDDE